MYNLQELGALSAMELAKLLWALATLDVHPPQRWLAAFMAAAEQRVARFDAESLAECIWALDKLDSSPGRRWTAWLVGEARARLVSRSPAGAAPADRQPGW